MAFFDHIEFCNSHDLSKFRPFKLKDGQQVGWINNDKIIYLKDFENDLLIESDQVILMGEDVHERTKVMEKICRKLLDQGHLQNWRDENYKVCESFNAPALFTIDRCAISFFGIRAYGVHINGFVRQGKDISMWIARRAADRYVEPNKLDNMVAGGQPAELSIEENLIKECYEEAGVSAELAKTATAAGMISYMAESEGGLKPDIMFVYDLEVPTDFVPINTDGEVAGFELMPIAKVCEIVKNTRNFKFNCNLVIIDFLIRHGFLTPDNTDDYEALVSGLRS